MSENLILFIVEGEKEEEIISCIAEKYLKHGSIKSLVYRSNIYQLFNVLKKVSNDEFEFLDTYNVLKEIATDTQKEKLNYKRDNVSEIYLFFDLDAHTTQARSQGSDGINTIKQMLALFNNEFVNGKLYISYPMIESYKHPFNASFLVPINNRPRYKKAVSQLCNIHGTELNDVKNIDKLLWDKTLTQHLIRNNDLVNDVLDIPNTYDVNQFTQLNVFDKQLQKHILPNREIRVLSPFALFLLDYLEDQLLNYWEDLYSLS